MKTIKKHTSFKFLDLCAGVGGFHQAMKALGGKCIGASEINPLCIETYLHNFPGTPMLGDLNEMDNSTEVEDFQVICAGFPCQPFSKAGKQQGFADEKRGQLFFKIMEIVDQHEEVEFILMENVRNLADKTNYWETILDELRKRSFVLTEDPLILSPSDFGIPQIRERVFILGIREDLIDKGKLPYSTITREDLDLKTKACQPESALEILESKVDISYRIPEDREEALLAWDEFRKATNIKTIGFPIWISHFGIGIASDKRHFRNMHIDEMPKWKQNYLKKNRDLYQMHREYIDDWLERYDMLKRIKLLQKFEWNCGEDVRDIKHGLIQIRQSGVRVKRPNYFPALVAMANTPIIWDKRMRHFREITPREAARLQSFNEEYEFVGSNRQAYKQLGNAVNVEIAKQLGSGLFNLRRREGGYS